MPPKKRGFQPAFTNSGARIGSVLAGFMHDLLKAPESYTEPNAPYFAALERLTAEDWRRSR